MRAILTGNASIGLFVLFLLALAAAWMTGRATAQGWESPVRTAVYLLLLALAIRFLHMALYGGTLLDPIDYVIDAVAALVAGLSGHRYNIATQMVTQYHWLYERTSPFSWKERSGGS
ncbi:MAG: hypothetical protein IPL47_04880 [Phyllobacteriaceae bacterium]|nr:hypothetical protein [Phyllobacteriaceae bacterium]